MNWHLSQIRGSTESFEAGGCIRALNFTGAGKYTSAFADQGRFSPSSVSNLIPALQQCLFRLELDHSGVEQGLWLEAESSQVRGHRLLTVQDCRAWLVLRQQHLVKFKPIRFILAQVPAIISVAIPPFQALQNRQHPSNGGKFVYICMFLFFNEQVFTGRT